VKISAVIPAYNSAAFIAEAIESIRQQTHPIDEIIIVDDGSTDNTEAIVHSTAPESIYIHQQNQGPSAARNRGIEAAGGDWIAFLDADDQWTTNKVAQQIAALENDTSLRLIAGDMAETDTNGKLIVTSVLAKHHQHKRFQTLAGKALPNALAALVEKNFIPTGTVLVRRDVLIDAGCFNPDIRFGEDLELWAKIACHHPITCLPEVLMQRRQHGANATQNTGPMLEDLVKVMRSISHYGSEQLTQQGTKPSTLVASALTALGYWHFCQGDYRQARKLFTASLKEHISKRTLVYAAACLLPNTVIKGVKTLKQQNAKAPQ
jgi:glycosyltransferase involved in cell wall biosynthesis